MMSKDNLHLQKNLDWLLSRYKDEEERNKVLHAFEFAAEAHKFQTRKSGAPYVTHPLAVASILSEIGMDPASVCAGLLHDVIEDTDYTVEDLTREFGEDIAIMVDGVTKLSKIECKTKTDRQVESFRKMFLAMAKDIRVIIIKLADRLHNMRTLDVHNPEKQQEIAKETIEIYAPLAHRLGIFQLKNELEDLSLRYLYPEEYFKIVSDLASLRLEREEYIDHVITVMQEKLRENSLTAFEIKGRPKHVYSIWRKMRRQNKELSEIYDLMAIRIIVESIQDCYAALGIIHTIWKPIPGRFKDFIAVPKENMYQSIHTTVIGRKGEPFEIQIRTEEMNRVAEYGVAAHWIYKEGAGKTYDQYFEWLRQSLEWQNETNNNEEYIEMLKLDMFEDIVFVFTPKGDVVELPQGATPLDFAYKVHTDVGHRCIGAKVNSRIVTLDHILKNGDIIEIMTTKTPAPKPDWLNMVHTSQAKSKIRAWFKKEKRSENLEKGLDLLKSELGSIGPEAKELVKNDALQDIGKSFGIADTEDFFVAIGEGTVSVKACMNRIKEKFFADLLYEENHKTDEETINAQGATLEAKMEKKNSTRSSNGIIVQGVEGVMVKLSKCCNPLPGDEIIGYITRGRGVSVHRIDCPNAKKFLEDEDNRAVEVQWDETLLGSFSVEIVIIAMDRNRLASDILGVVSDQKVPILYIHARQTGDGKVQLNLKVEIKNLAHLDYLLNKLGSMKDVLEVHRIVPGKKGKND